VFLKATEGTAKLVSLFLLEAVSRLTAEVQEAILPALATVSDKLDPEVHGGAQLLGVRGVTVIAHGSSTRVAISNALTMASDGAERNLPGRIAEQLG
jgi:glycerol-3-phosphate acyltransferase PlsX